MNGDFEKKDEMDGQSFSEQTYKTLILRAYKNYEIELRKLTEAKNGELTFLESKLVDKLYSYGESAEIIQNKIMECKRALAQMEKDLRNIGSKFTEIEQNLK